MRLDDLSVASGIEAKISQKWCHLETGVSWLIWQPVKDK